MTKVKKQKKLDEKGVKDVSINTEAQPQESLNTVDVAVVAPTAPVTSEAEIQRITDELSGKNARPIEDTLKMTQRLDGEVQTPSGIIIPHEVLTHLSPTKWFYKASCVEDSCAIVRYMKNGYREDVREYTRAIHGDRFKELAEGFVAKNNAK